MLADGRGHLDHILVPDLWRRIVEIAWRLSMSDVKATPAGTLPRKRPKYSLLETGALTEAQESPTLEIRAKNVETLKNLNEARFQRWQAFATVVPLLALVVTALTLTYQTRQQQKQAEKEAETQRNASEDSQWREAMKLVSFRDPFSSQVGALAMQSFFSSSRYGTHARAIAGALLTNVSSVSTFDEVISQMKAHTNVANYGDLIGVAQMLGFSQRARFHIKHTASSQNTPYLTDDVGDIDPNPRDLEHNDLQKTKVAAWELDTVSNKLRQLWIGYNGQVPLSPHGWDLAGVVVEDGIYDNLDFARANFNYGILYNASFKDVSFKEASFRNTYVRDVKLNGADFAGVTQFSGSRWEDTGWQDAKCIPPQMLEYLMTVDPQPLTSTEKSLLVSNCH
jgi:uncharacterized protein YjbI with pentapeptide repeats